MATHRSTLIFATVLLTCAPALFAQDAPPAHVAFADGAATIERDGTVDGLTSGMPLVAGDRLQTGAGRIEVFFDSGSRLFMDEWSTLDLLAPGSLRLLSGGLTFDVLAETRTSAMYQLDTPAGSVFIMAPGEYNIVGKEEPAQFSLRVQVVRGAVDLVAENGRTGLTSGEESFVRTGEPPAFPVRFNTARWDTFGRWVEARRADERLATVSRQYLPPVMQSYASTLDRNGSWVDDSQYGVVWYPTVGGGWRPYRDGRWNWVSTFGWTWVGAETWAWPTLHYGRWCTNAAGSWFWIPGTVWGRAAPMILRQHGGGAERVVRRDPPGLLAQPPRAATMGQGQRRFAPGPGGPASAFRDPVQQDPLQHDALTQPLPPIGLPLPRLGLPPAHQPTSSVPRFGTPSFGVPPPGAVGRAGWGTQTGTMGDRQIRSAAGAPPPPAPPAPPSSAGRTSAAPAGPPPRGNGMPMPGWMPPITPAR